jgi:hypothetical protein
MASNASSSSGSSSSVAQSGFDEYGRAVSSSTASSGLESVPESVQCQPGQQIIQDYNQFIDDLKEEFKNKSGKSDIDSLSIDSTLVKKLSIINNISKGGCFQIYKFNIKDDIKKFKTNYKNYNIIFIDDIANNKLINDDNNDTDKNNKYMLTHYTKEYMDELNQEGGYYKDLQKYKLKLQKYNIFI